MAAQAAAVAPDGHRATADDRAGLAMRLDRGAVDREAEAAARHRRPRRPGGRVQRLRHGRARGLREVGPGAPPRPRSDRLLRGRVGAGRLSAARTDAATPRPDACRRAALGVDHAVGEHGGARAALADDRRPLLRRAISALRRHRRLPGSRGLPALVRATGGADRSRRGPRGGRPRAAGAGAMRPLAPQARHLLPRSGGRDRRDRSRSRIRARVEARRRRVRPRGLGHRRRRARRIRGSYRIGTAANAVGRRG